MNFSYEQTTKIVFGRGKIDSIGEIASQYGKNVLLVTESVNSPLAPLYERVKGLLQQAGLTVHHYDGVVPNPTTESVDAGTQMARSEKVDAVIGIGGGSSMDTAKAVAMAAINEGRACDYLFFKKQPEKTLPCIAVTTTSGTGSQVTQVAVMTETATQTKSAVFNNLIYPRVAIVDPDLMVTVPRHTTASTGFDAFCHCFESYINVNGSAYTDIIALEGIRMVAKYLRRVVKSIREEIIRLGGEVRFNTQVTGFSTQSGRITAVRTEAGEVPAETVILAVGHSARDTFRAVREAGAEIQPKPFSVGVRAEHLQSEVDRGLYGDFAGDPRLPVGEYQLSYRENGRGVYTFCMCPGGFVVPSSSEEGGVVTNGMSEYSRSGRNANSAVVVSVDSSDFGNDWDSGIRYQRELEQSAFRMGGSSYRAPVQTVGRFLSGQAGADFGRVEPTYAIGIEAGDFDRLFTAGVASMLRKGLENFARKLPAYAAADAVLTAPETRTSSPVRIPRGDDVQAAGLRGLYPCGEGAGYAGGIMSAAVDGIRCAGAIIGEYAPIQK